MSNPSPEIIEHILKHIPEAIEIGRLNYSHLPVGHTLRLPLLPPLHALSLEDDSLIFPLRLMLTLSLIRTPDEDVFRFTGEFQESLRLADDSTDIKYYDLAELDDWPEMIDGVRA